MVDAAAILAAEPNVERGHAVVLQKSCVIRTGTESRDAQIGAFANFFTLLGSFGTHFFWNCAL